MGVKTLSRSFSHGEITQEMYGRVDLQQFQTALATCRNFETLPHGPAVNRPGFQFVREVKDSTKRTRVIPFSYNNTQTFCVEIGAGYFRFFTQAAYLTYGAPAAWSNAVNYVKGDLVTSGGNVYYCILDHINHVPPNATYWYLEPSDGTLEVPNIYAEADLFDIHYVQSADVLSLAHPTYPPSELRRLSAVNWSFIPVTFGSGAVAPTGVTATPTGAGATTYTYVVTTVLTTGLEESNASATAACTNDLTLAGHFNTITWAAATGAVRYNVYKFSNGLYGYIGQAGALSFVDNNITADISQTPPITDNPFVDSTTYPAEVSYYDQRRMFAGSNTKPQNFWGTRSGTESNLTYSIPSRDDDRLSFRIAAREASSIRHIIPLTDMLLLTASGEWRVQASGGGALTPSTTLIQPQTYIGASNVKPAVVNRSVLYPQARGGRIRELTYQWQASGYVSNDLSILAPHLFDYKIIVDMAYAKAPYSILWVVNSDGQLLGLTYVPEQQVSAWHRHDTDGLFESVCVVSEGNEDFLYAVIRRTINGVSKRYIERKHSRYFADPADAFFVDCGGTYDGAATTTINGLTWLEGKTVNILADGAVHPQKVVTGGSITLDQAASTVQVGLPITADLVTLPLVFETEAAGQGRAKNINKVWLRVVNSSGIFVGPDFDNLTEYKQRTTEPWGSPPALQSTELDAIVLTPSWGQSGQVYIRQTYPLPLTLTSMTIEAAVGG